MEVPKGSSEIVFCAKTKSEAQNVRKKVRASFNNAKSIYLSQRGKKYADKQPICIQLLIQNESKKTIFGD